MTKELIRYEGEESRTTWEAEGFRLDLAWIGVTRWNGGLWERPAYEYTLWDGDEVISAGHDLWGPALGAWPEPEEMVATCLGFLSVQPGDTDEEYFAGYTPRQLEWAESDRCELLSLLASEMEPDPDGES
jgi:hypothetical protein